MDLLFLTLRSFSATGGIEKVCRYAGKAFCAAGGADGAVRVYSAYDRSAACDERYVPAAAFRGFGGNRLAFAWQSLRRGVRSRVVVLSHVNLLPVGYVIKRLSPRTRLVLLAHGIEVWPRFPAWKRHLLRRCDLILPVSGFTRQKMVERHGLCPERLRVVNNCLDPFLPPAAKPPAAADLRRRYGLTAGNKVLLTVTRLSGKEGAKGHDRVLEALQALKKTMPETRYILAGGCSRAEGARIDQRLKELDLEGEVIRPGFVPESELPALFALADLFIMPSQKEGFGLVFTEALYYGLPVIAGNKDGSVDALAGGRFGVLVDPDNADEIGEAIQAVLRQPERFAPDRSAVLERFGFAGYEQALRQAIGPFLPGRGAAGRLEGRRPQQQDVFN